MGRSKIEKSKCNQLVAKTSGLEIAKNFSCVNKLFKEGRKIYSCLVITGRMEDFRKINEQIR